MYLKCRVMLMMLLLRTAGIRLETSQNQQHFEKMSRATCATHVIHVYCLQNSITDVSNCSHTSVPAPFVIQLYFCFVYIFFWGFHCLSCFSCYNITNHVSPFSTVCTFKTCVLRAQKVQRRALVLD